MTRYDAIVIGTGQAGPSLARRLASEGQKVAIIERGRFGGTCINTGCTPTKALVASAYLAHAARRASEFGIVIDTPVRIDMARVHARMRAIAEVSRNAVERSLRSAENITAIQGHARFTDPHVVAVNDTALGADRIFINVGARPVVPAIAGLDTVRYSTSSSILDLEIVPRHLIVIGGSYVGLEFAQVFRRLGSAVTVVETAPNLVPREDADIAGEILKILRVEGIDVHLAAQTQSVARQGDGVTATVSTPAGEEVLAGSHLLLATGRRPNTDDLGLDRTGVVVDRHGYIQVDEALRTTAAGIWALGECNGHGAFTHTAYNDFQIVAANLLDGTTRSVNDRIPAYALFIDPPLGRAGMTEAAARASHRRVRVASIPMEDVSRAYEKSETFGLMKIVVDGDTEEILGAAVLGTGGDEAIHCVLDMMYAGASYKRLRDAVHIHPTVAEFIPTLLDGI